MANLDDILARYHLSDLEEAIERRRRAEESKYARLVARRRRLEKQLKKVERELTRARAKAAGAEGQP